MNEFIGLVFQPNLDSELLHLALAGLAAIGGLIGTVISVALGVVVKRAVTKFFAQQDAFEKRIARIERAMGITAITDGRATDGDGRAVL